MIRKLMLAMVLGVALSFGTTAFAKTCPKLVHQIDAMLPKSSLSADAKEKVKEMRDKGNALHKQGKHAESERVLREALALLGM